ncbi:phage major capsid protein [Rhizobium multihospitium]|uniref:Phage major capsid protein, HK97 family n=1 Tax=Rhizobium multihospitium TaxID=410764 RepID=A0A1C3WL59_9HYPH|nr:phage major capsid protein [Rhizobium multihospitium]SCB40773.1 phage major capsid protein, HK97 family [Rhizobium multihospitium]
MTSIHNMRSERAALVTEMRAALSAGKTPEFDKLAKDVEALDAKINAEERMAAYETARSVARDTLETELRSYSVSRALAGFLNGNLEGREAEIAQELGRGQSTRGLRIPLSAIADYEQREVTAAGNPAIADQKFGNLIPRLTPASTVIRSGATVLNGLGYGSIALPRFVGGPDAQIAWLPESGAAPQGNATFDNVVLQPHTAAVYLKISRRALVTNSIGLDAVLRADLNAALGRAVDSVALQGGQTNAPKGIMSLITETTTASGADISDVAADLLAVLENANQNSDSAVFYITNAVAQAARKLKTTDKLPIPLETNFFGRKPYVTNIATGQKVIAAVPSDILIGFWNQAGTAPSVDIIIDTASYSSEGALKIVGFTDVDVGLKNGAASAAWADLAA